MRYLSAKLHSPRGRAARLTVLLLAAVAALLAAAAVPAARGCADRAGAYACAVSLDKAREAVVLDYVQNGGGQELAAARAAAGEQAVLCPSGGDVYLVPAGDSYALACALHDGDAARRTRLNAANALGQLRDALEKEWRLRETVPEAVTVTLNGAPLTLALADELPPLRRGTRATSGYDGTAAYFTAADGAVTAFVYADENHAAVWRAADGWTGDAYR